jgi:tRNA modification GTPase
MEFTETITALATPRGSSALAVIRVSGSSALTIFAKLIQETEPFIAAPSKYIRIYHFTDPSTDEIVDEITAIKYCRPNSFTGEDMIELICHGGRIVVDRILEILLAQKIRYAKPGEFTRRAFLNGKTNLAKAEAINQIISSSSLRQQREAVQSYMGGYSQLLMDWRQKVENLLVEIESEIEFAEEDDIVLQRGRISRIQILEEMKGSINQELAKRNQTRHKCGGFEIAIVGPQNAGKSSFLNFILGYDRSIVHSQRGTTRDVIAEQVYLGEYEFRFYDTAGLCAAQDSVEKIGIDRSWQYLQSCDAVIWITSADEEFYPEEIEIINKRVERRGLLAFINKIDLAQPQKKMAHLSSLNIPCMALTVLDPAFQAASLDFIKEQLSDLYESQSQNGIIINNRQEMCIKDILIEIEGALHCEENQHEILSLHCRNVLDKIEEFTGKRSSEEIINAIFSQFCVGK